MPTFNTLFTDTFTRANENPLSDGGNWSEFSGGGLYPLQVLGDACAGTNTTNQNTEYYNGTLPNDQYAEATVAAIGEFSFLWVFAREGSTIDPSLSGYGLSFNKDSDSFRLQAASSFLYSGTGALFVGDTFLLATYGTTIAAYHNGTQIAAVTDSTYSSGKVATACVVSNTVSDTTIAPFTAGSVFVGYSISGNAGIAGATVAYSGTSSGSVTADGSGDFTISGLNNGTYLLTPSSSDYGFTPPNRNVTVSGGNVTGIDFTAFINDYYSVPDCRTFPPNFATYRLVNGTKTYDVQTSSNGGIPPDDSREDVPVASGEYPQNSRKPGVYGPGE
jgi:hypothetical protein